MRVKMKTIFRRMIAITIITLVFIVTWCFLRFAYLDDSGYACRITMHEFYNQDNIDVLVLGASHCYRGIDPAVTDRILGCNTFIASSAGQRLNTSFLLMKEAVEVYDVQHIYVDLSYNVAKASLNRGDGLGLTYFITDYMRPSLKKFGFLLEHSGEGNYVNSFLVARREWDPDTFNLPYMESVIKKKMTQEYRDYQYIHDSRERYAGKGFIASDSARAEGSMMSTFDGEHFDLNEIDEAWPDVIREMIQYCKRHDVSLSFFSTPVSSYRLMCYEKYDDFIAYTRDLIDSCGNPDVEYIDFNLMREDYWQDTAGYYSDMSHLNTRGAEIFSEVFSRYVQGEISDDDLFYSSIREKYESLPAHFYGLEYSDDADGDGYRDGRLITNHPERMRSSVVLSDCEEEQSVLKKMSSGTDFRIPAGYSGRCAVEIAFGDGDSRLYEFEFQQESAKSEDS